MGGWACPCPPWDTGIPDARIVASMVAEPALLTSRQMDA
jgi:hypothetical protein